MKRFPSKAEGDDAMSTILQAKSAKPVARELGLQIAIGKWWCEIWQK
jgi:hypothetical protein